MPVAFGPHPDDVELCCGGVICKLSSEGFKVAVVDLTRGELGSQGTPEIRKQEADAAAKVLGIDKRENLELPDGFISSETEQLASVVAALRRLRPEIVLAPYHQGRHPDHEAASDLITKACFFSGLANYKVPGEEPSFSPRQVLYYQMRYRFKPSFIVDISNFSEQKLKAIQCYGSQVRRAAELKDKTDAPLISSPLSLSSLIARDQYYGAMIGTQHAEPFFTRTALSISDPLKFFRDNPTEGALFFSELP